MSGTVSVVSRMGSTTGPSEGSARTLLTHVRSSPSKATPNGSVSVLLPVEKIGHPNYMASNKLVAFVIS